MPANVVGSVHRTDRPDAVILHIAGSRAALWTAVRLIVVLLLGGLTILLAIHVSDARIGGAPWQILWTFGGAALLWWYVGRHVPPLLRTAFVRVTIKINMREVEVLTHGDKAPTRVPWRARGIDDVLVVPQPGGAGALRIVPSVGRPTKLFYGLAKPELEFVAATLRDALRLTARDAEADETEAPRDEEFASDAAATPGPTPVRAPVAVEYSSALDYASMPPNGIAFDSAPE
ncbi:MAG: hypothetical protein QOF78_4047, partial [Phycisphaerales bacterium]|nr:hypothetical protein [Phycisphaerales bacterium]